MDIDLITNILYAMVRTGTPCCWSPWGNWYAKKAGSSIWVRRACC